MTLIRGIIGFILFVLNLTFWIIPYYVVAILKLIIPIAAWRRLCVRWLEAIGEIWIDCNNFFIATVAGIKYDIAGNEDLRRRDWYLVSSNHQTWVDVVVLQRTFNRRIPFLKFFIKKQLIWVPLLGLAWWALELPFMHRHSRAEIDKNPELRGQDLEITRQACARFSETPTSLINFVEGTRFNEEKRQAQDAPYQYLLNPKAGGIAFALAAMGETMHKLLDVTIVYPQGGGTFWELLSGQIGKVIVRVRQLEIPQEFLGGDYLNDPEFRERFQRWVRELWQEKDQLIGELMAAS
ncbi:MAG: acyltransferase [Gammaproteobacteria bacterium]|nr:acyltransferase [Gammaproteobacteria bacterium]NNF60374.1 acyltransferase [Gammaproteobacteria bacterium]